MITGERTRLIELYHRATVDSGRYEQVDRQRFLLGLLDKLKSYRDIITAPIPAFDPLAPWKLFLNQRAAYQGGEISSALTFIIDELQARFGTSALRQTLYHCSSDVALAIARRIATPRATANLRLAAVRVMVDGRPRDNELAGTLLSIGECARHDVILPADAGAIELAVAIDNPGTSPAWFPALEVRLQAQWQQEGLLKTSPVSVFGSLLRVEPGKRAWIAFRGVDLLRELRSEAGAGDQLHAIRFLFTRK